MFETQNNAAAKKANNSNVLTLDKDVSELQLTYDMFKHQINQFSCLRKVVQLIHAELALDKENNVSQAYAAMKLGQKKTNNGLEDLSQVVENTNPINDNDQPYGR